MFSIFLLISSCFLFSVLAVLIKFNSQFIHPIEQAFFRNLLSIFLLLPFILRSRQIIKDRGNIKLLILRGIFGGITMILLFCSYSMIPLSQAMAISFSTPLFIYLGGIIFFKEKTTKFNSMMLAIGFILTLVIIRPDLEIQIGALFALVASITHAIAGLLVKKISASESVVVLMFSMVILMTPITLIPSLYVWSETSNYTVWFLLLSIAIIATLGNYCWTKALSGSKLTNLMPFDFSKLVFTIILSYFIFEEKVDLITLICGSSLILCANLTVLNLKKNEKSKTILSNN